MISWKKELEVNVPEIDTQHKRLVEIASNAHTLLVDEFTPDKYDEIVRILEELEEYTEFHFDSEEKYMKSIGHKQLFSHIIEHRNFMNQIKGVDLRAVDENPDKYLLGIVNLVVDWVVHHILEVDKKAMGNLN